MKRKVDASATTTTTTTTIDQETPFSSVKALALIQRVTTQAWTVIRVLMVLVFVTFVITVGLQLQVSARNRNLDKFGHQLDRFEVQLNDSNAATQDAKTAAVESKKALEDALAQSQNGTVNAQAILDALSAIHRIEIRLCGGPCPDTEG